MMNIIQQVTDPMPTNLSYHHYIHVLDPILEVIVTYYVYDPASPE